jgi:rhodanese-related sulfurtransferase
MYDWIRSGGEVSSVEKLPEQEATFIEQETLFAIINEADKRNCVNELGSPLLTLLDFRSSLNNPVKIGNDHYSIKSTCRTIQVELDDFIDNQKLIDSIPQAGSVVTISETGNRDDYLIRFLNVHKHDNVVGLRFGIRGWMQKRYPVRVLQDTEAKK